MPIVKVQISQKKKEAFGKRSEAGESDAKTSKDQRGGEHGWSFPNVQSSIWSHRPPSVVRRLCVAAKVSTLSPWLDVPKCTGCIMPHYFSLCINAEVNYLEFAREALAELDKAKPSFGILTSSHLQKRQVTFLWTFAQSWFQRQDKGLATLINPKCSALSDADAPPTMELATAGDSSIAQTKARSTVEVVEQKDILCKKLQINGVDKMLLHLFQDKGDKLASKQLYRVLSKLLSFRTDHSELLSTEEDTSEEEQTEEDIEEDSP